MRGCIGVVVFVVVVAPMLFLFEVTAAASTFLVNRAFYTDVFASPDVYAGLVAGVMAEAGSEGRPPTDAELERITATLDATEWRAAVGDAVDQFFAVVEGRSDTLTIRIPLAPLRAVLESSAGEAFVRDYIASLPTCRAGQEPTDSPGSLGGLPLPVCVPQTTTASAYAELMIERLPQMTASMPPEIVITEHVTDVPQVEALGEMGVQGAVTAALAAFGAAAVGGWFITGMIAGATAGSRLRWLGVTLLLPSLGVLLIGFAVGGSMALMRDGAGMGSMGAMGSMGSMDSRLSEAIYSALGGGLGRIALSFAAAGGIPAAIGLMLWLAGMTRRDPYVSVTERDLFANPTTQIAPKPKNDFAAPTKPKNDRVDDTGDIIKPL